MAFGNLWGLLMTLICFSHLPLNRIQNAPDLQKVATSWQHIKRYFWCVVKRGLILVHINTNKKKPTQLHNMTACDTLTKNKEGLVAYF